MKRSLNRNYQPGFVEVVGSGGLNLGYEFDEVGNVKKLRTANQAEPPLRTYGYDGLNRLTETKDGATNAVLEAYAYDSTGNRTSATVGGTTTAYSYGSANHRLNGVGTTARSHDAAGNTTQIGGAAKEFVYDDLNRMSLVRTSGTTTRNYAYNGRGEQVRTWQAANDDRYSVYDEGGQWLGEYDSAGAPTQQIVWLYDLPAAVITGSGATRKLHYIEADALGTPRVVVDPTRGTSGTAIWRWELTGEAFGNTAPNQDPDNDGTAFVFDMRFPGQRYDAASGLNYNYFRDYDAATGRYAKSDPIGLDGGISTYVYAHSSSLQFIDPDGLQPVTCSNLRGAQATIQCDGRGGYEIVNCNRGCTRECTQKHEQVHIDDWKRRYGRNSCANRARGDLPSDTNQQAGINYERLSEDKFGARSECRAWKISKECAEGIGSEKGCPNECRTDVDRMINTANYWKVYYLCESYGWW